MPNAGIEFKQIDRDTYQVGRATIWLDWSGLFPHVCGKYPADASEDEAELYAHIIRECEAQIGKAIDHAFLYGDGVRPQGMTPCRKNAACN